MSDDVRINVYNRDGWRCRYVDKNGIRCRKLHDLQLAHIIAKSQANMKAVLRHYVELFNRHITQKKAMQILNSELNLKASCSEHNQLLMNNSDEYIKAYVRVYKELIDD